MHPRKSACSDPPNHVWHCSHLRLNRSSTDPQPPCNRHLEFRGAVLTLETHNLAIVTPHDAKRPGRMSTWASGRARKGSRGNREFAGAHLFFGMIQNLSSG
ncbi:hypothetical protein CWT15_08630 [Bifidobacterium longum]|nr:hypothetical protein CWT15_08630 [Bifidobacterium longum]